MHDTSTLSLAHSSRTKWGVSIAAAIALLLGILGVRGPVFAQAGDEDGDASPVKVRAVPRLDAVHPGDRFPIAIVLNHAKHFHTWPGEPVGKVPSGLEDLTPIWTTIEPATDDAGEPRPMPSGWVMGFSHVQWAQPAAVSSGAFTGSPLTILSQVDRAVSYLPVIVPMDAAPGDYVIPITVSYQACNDTMCLPPEATQLDVTVKVVAAAQAGAPLEPDLFKSFDPKTLDGVGSTPVPAPTQPKPDAPLGNAPAAPGESVHFNELGLNFVIDPSGPVGLTLLLLMAFLGGLVLNFTPCVLPVIPIKILSLQQQAGNRSRCLLLGAVMAAGIVVFWLGVGVATYLFQITASGLFGLWWFTTLMGAFILVMGVGMLGMFSVRLPQAVYMLNPSHESPGGSFFFGILTAVLALPCVAPFMGTMMTWAATQPALMIFATFAVIGVGMALPYFLLAANPSWVNRMPRTGPASELIKQVMGLLMIAVAAFFIGTSIRSLLAEYPYLAKTLHWWVAAVVAVLAAFWLAFRTFQITQSPSRRLTFTLVAIGFAAVPVLIARSLTSIHYRLYLAKQADAKGVQHQSGLWQDYRPEAVAAARREGKVVVLDFTADWCITCQVLKATVLGREDVESALSQNGVTSFLVDLTSTSAPGWKELRSLGEKGIPLLAVFVPGQDDPIFKSNAYTPDQVTAAINGALEARAQYLRTQATELAGSGNPLPLTPAR